MAVGAVAKAKKEIFDPFNVFCGSRNCYDILGVEREDNMTTISRSYRQLSRTMHPDKVHPDRRVNVTEEFRLLAKAYEVVKGNESRPNFDWYLDHPRSYFKATGKHAWRALPKAHPVFVTLFALLVASGLGHYLQISKHKRAYTTLKSQVKSGLKLNRGGSALSLDLHQKAVNMYIDCAKKAGVKLSGNPMSSPAANDKMHADPKFDEICSTVVSDIKDWGDYAMPTNNDLLIVRAFTVWPGSISNAIVTFHRRHLSGKPLSAEDKADMARTLVGPSTWDSLNTAEQQAAINDKVYESEGYDKWLAQRDGGFTEAISKRQQKMQKKLMEKKAYLKVVPRDPKTRDLKIRDLTE